LVSLDFKTLDHSYQQQITTR